MVFLIVYTLQSDDVKKVAENGKVSKTPKPKRLSEAAKTDVSKFYFDFNLKKLIKIKMKKKTIFL